MWGEEECSSSTAVELRCWVRWREVVLQAGLGAVERGGCDEEEGWWIQCVCLDSGSVHCAVRHSFDNTQFGIDFETMPAIWENVW